MLDSPNRVERDQALCHVEFCRQSLKQRVLEVRDRAVLGNEPGKCLQSHSLSASYFGQYQKCNFFLASSINGRLFCGRCAAGAFLLGQQHNAQHLVEGGGLAGPDFELAGGLVDEHFNTRDDLRSPFLS